MKRVISVAVAFSLILLCFCGCTSEDDEKIKPTKEFYVNDFADVISAADEEKILSKGAELKEKTTAQVVVITINDLNGQEPYEFAADIGNEWGVGDKEKDNGVIILLALNERKIEIATGDGTGGIIPASKAGRIIDEYGIEKLKNDDFSGGITAIFDAVVNEIYIANGLETPEGYVPIDKIEENEEPTFAYWFVMVAVIVVLSFLTRRRGGGFFFFPMGFYGGGRHGGGSGGFGGFSGGGGSFGGGGAGRGF